MSAPEHPDDVPRDGPELDGPELDRILSQTWGDKPGLLGWLTTALILGIAFWDTYDA